LSEGNFVLQEHRWGEKHHFDLRFEKNNSEGKPIMIGWTLLADSQQELDDKIKSNTKILSKRKMYHDPKWLTFEGDIQPGNEGNPTKNFVAHMEIRDTGHYKFNRRQVDFVDMELSGAKNPEFNGRFYLRLVKMNKDSEGSPKPEGRILKRTGCSGKRRSWTLRSRVLSNLSQNHSGYWNHQRPVMIL